MSDQERVPEQIIEYDLWPVILSPRDITRPQGAPSSSATKVGADLFPVTGLFQEIGVDNATEARQVVDKILNQRTSELTPQQQGLLGTGIYRDISSRLGIKDAAGNQITRTSDVTLPSGQVVESKHKTAMTPSVTPTSVTGTETTSSDELQTALTELHIDPSTTLRELYSREHWGTTDDGSYYPLWLSGPETTGDDDSLPIHPIIQQLVSILLGSRPSDGMVLDPEVQAGIIPGVLQSRSDIREAIEAGHIDPSSLPEGFLDAPSPDLDMTIGELLDQQGIEYTYTPPEEVDLSEVDPDLEGTGTADQIESDRLIETATGWAADPRKMQEIFDRVLRGTPVDEALSEVFQEIMMGAPGIGVEFQGPTPDYILITIPGLPLLTETGVNKISLKNPDGSWKTPTQIETDIGEMIDNTVTRISELPGQIVEKVEEVLTEIGEIEAPGDVWEVIEGILEGVSLGGGAIETPPWLHPEVLIILSEAAREVLTKWEEGDEEIENWLGSGWPTDDATDDTVDITDDTVDTTDVTDDTIETVDTTDVTDDTTDVTDDTIETVDTTDVTDDTTDVTDDTVETVDTTDVTDDTTDVTDDTVETVDTTDVTDDTTDDTIDTTDVTYDIEGGDDGGDDEIEIIEGDGGGGGGGGGMFGGGGDPYMDRLSYQLPPFVQVDLPQTDYNRQLNRLIEENLFLNTKKGMLTR